MKPHLESILEDIYTLEPDLRERDTEVRAIVTGLLKARPKAAIDPEFRRVLRARVLDSVVRAKPKEAAPYGMLWWALRIAPIGAIAAISLALIGDRGVIDEPRIPQNMGDGYVSETRSVSPTMTQSPTMTLPMGAGQGSDMMTMSAPASPAVAPSRSIMAKEGVGTSEDAALSDPALMTMDYGDDADAEMPEVYPSSIYATEQLPSFAALIQQVNLEVPGHIRVFSYGDGKAEAVLGTTGLIPAGIYENLFIELLRPTEPGEVLSAQLFASNGDEIFRPYEDEPVRDAAGNLVYVIFSISSD